MPELINWDLLLNPYNWIVVTLILAFIVGTLVLLMPSVERVGYGPLNPFLQ